MKELPVFEGDVRDEDVFEALDLSIPQLIETKQAYEKGDMRAAKKAFISYLETRQAPVYYFDYRALPLEKIDTDTNPYYFQSALGLSGDLKSFCMYVASRMMDNIYVLPGRGRGEVDLGRNFENMIHFNFLEDQGKRHRHSLDMFVRGQFFESLAVAYHETGDRKYIDKFIELLNVFFRTYPLRIADTSPSASRFQYDEDRDVMSAGWLTMVYTTLLYTRLPYETDPELAFEIVKRIWFIGIQFTRFSKDGYRMYNHHLWERGLVPFMLSIMYPEFPAFRKMRKWGASVVKRHVMDDFGPTGGYSEHSIAYWSGASLGEMMSRGLIIARLNSVPLLGPKEAVRIDRSFTLLALISAPGERYPSIGDNRGPMIDPILNLGIIATGNKACSDVICQRHGSANETTIPLDYSDDSAGFTVSRSAYTTDANYLLVSTKNNCGYTGHNHMDMLSLCLSIRGEEIIGEPYSGKLYHNVKMNSPQRGYMYNMGSHNTVLCYGKPIQDDMAYANKWGVYRPDTPVECFRITKHGTYMKARHKAYTFCEHVREIWFSRKRGILVQDTIERGNRLNKAHIQRWHLMDGCEVTRTSKNSLRVTKNGVSVMIVTDPAATIKIWKNTKVLVPSIYPDESYLSPIIDICFKAPEAKQADVAAAKIRTMIIDVTEDGSIPAEDSWLEEQ
ncbi:MAG: heparinase II/III family protein [Bullifex sp.]|nr:heparinase II/III family protein [Bullifex sp.]